MFKDGCPLCEMHAKTHWYYDGPDFLICDCLTCKVPMYVWKDHNFPTQEQLSEMVTDARSRFPDRQIDMRRRQIPDHFHFHMR